MLKSQLQDSVFRQEDLENEAIRMRTDLRRQKIENENLSKKVNQLEVSKYKYECTVYCVNL